MEISLQQLKQVHKEAKESLCKAADLILPTHFKPYQTGDKVWLEGHNLNTTHPSSKLAPRCYRPFSITHVVSCTSYQLRLPSQWKLHDVFHASLLTPYKEMALNGQHYQEPIPDLIDGQPEWEVESILEVRRWRNQLQFLVCWKGFSEAHDCWEPASNIHADELVQDFYKRHPLAICTTPFPLIIRSTNMSTTPLSDRIEDALALLTLEEHLSSLAASTLELPLPLTRLSPSLLSSLPTPTLPNLPLIPINTHPLSHAYSEPSEAEVDIGMIGCDLSMPPGFTMFDPSIPNHHNYRQKIEIPDSTHRWPHYIQFIVNTTTHNHYVYATHDDLH